MSSDRPYRLRHSGAIIVHLRDLLQRAVALGVRDRFIQSLKTIDERLTTDPKGWGDPVYELRHAELTIYHKIHDELSVVYGVHEREPSVWLTRITPVFSHPLRERS